MKSLISAFRDLLLHLLPRAIVQLIVGSVDFVFVIHPRDHHDVCRKFAFLQVAPIWVVNLITQYLWPVLGPVISGIRTREGILMKGRVVFSPLTAEQMFKDLHSARNRILSAVRLSEKMSPKVIGLGALTASVMRGKWEALDNVKALITSGSIFTSVLVKQAGEEIVKKTGRDIKECTVAVVGAAGLVGSLVSKLLADHVGRLILVDRRMKVLAGLGKELSEQVKIRVDVTKDLAQLRHADVIIAATNAITSVLDPEDLPPGTLIVDDSRPTSTPLDLMEHRPDVIVVEGGVGHLNGMTCAFDFGLVKEDDVFGCLGETILLCWDRMYERRHLEGKTDMALANELEKISKEIGIELAEFQWQGRVIENFRFENIKNIKSSKIREFA